jgi:hypothetical protein
MIGIVSLSVAEVFAALSCFVLSGACRSCAQASRSCGRGCDHDALAYLRKRIVSTMDVLARFQNIRTAEDANVR